MRFMPSTVTFCNRPEPIFPLLTKILDANGWLSVQVHPDDAYGLEHEGELGKTECWYVIAADEGGRLWSQCQEQGRAAPAGETSWDHLLTKIPVKAGISSMSLVAPCHTIGSGF